MRGVHRRTVLPVPYAVCGIRVNIGERRRALRRVPSHAEVMEGGTAVGRVRVRGFGFGLPVRGPVYGQDFRALGLGLCWARARMCERVVCECGC